ncbi:sigma-70 family RNA polymerase sigma factor [Allorhodopirellula solitaria]|uniref:RNA polymerase sigma factor n=1 Tax=Allorhodopirellula solitaria TaxID=2527987 RepID=A0A5C5YJK8_9BACT|nr:sigma-70 family RNA polymerase sigma factor [Allorhodopirellula solitaria]TWT75028.1 RNA polymerase sigma factor [Allorhodopirellula solitaria]
MYDSEVPQPPLPHDDLAVEIATMQPRLYGFILKRLADREQTLEVLQRTNLVLCRKADQFARGSSFAAWAFTIAKFQVLAWRKSDGSERLVFTDEVSALVDRSVDDEAESVDDRVPLLRQCLETLRSRDRELIQQRYRDGKPVARIAENMSKSVDAIAMQLSRVRRQLGECVRMKLENST